MTTETNPGYPRRTVVGAMLEFQGAWQAMAAAMLLPPHHQAPVHPVLYIKPANTWARPGQPVLLPPEVTEVEVGATLGISFARAASRVHAADALQFVAGYCVVNDVTVPHSALLRPPMRQKCRDGFCPIGPWMPASALPDPGALTLRAYVNGELRQSNNTRQLRRSVARLIADVSEFMTLAPGDLLLVGVPEGAPRVRAGDTMAVEIDGIGRLENPLQHEARSAQETA
jgi:5-oxopent-3-ene-1,2,5-tricarboxylate decarboxylase / 2-hydroxyhepta-2,4-diene-1,7-dioate isomerase